ncbi:hypothetical protein ANCCAN_09743 [Ancylostoma caninum]|uniref:Uncharacterized protein n=1 Tax=Ancylostoma caninum TaxID=29170 RepID=A0A368GIU6_ANCCA|nr:hypothetical protein ANCCAN_09743 [Ancylostoma caninum]
MRVLFISLCVLEAIGAEKFLSFTKAELCEAEPHLSMCRQQARAHDVKSFSEKDLKEMVGVR